MLELHLFLKFHPGMINKLYEGELKTSAEAYIDPSRSGRLNKIRTCSENDWKSYKDFLKEFELLDPSGDISLNTTAACDVRNWISRGYSVSRIIKIMLSWDSALKIPRKAFHALQVYEEVIRKDGAIHNSSGHTVLPVEALVELLTSRYPLGYMNHQGRTDEDADGIGYNDRTAIELLEELVEIGLLDFMDRLGEPKWGVYVPEYMNLERRFVEQLAAPCEPIEIDMDQIQALWDTGDPDADQFKATLKLLGSPTVGGALAGYPGGGKTRTCGTLANYLGPQNVVALTTTGAAALVLERQLPAGVNCTTISSAYFNLPNKKWADWWSRPYLIMDEGSMLSMCFLEQWVKLVDRIQPKKIIIVGDPKQLPPVGAGAVFENLVKGDMGVASSVLHGQHRMNPAALGFLKQLESEVRWVDALYSRNNQEGFSLSRVQSDTHLIRKFEAVDILTAVIGSARDIAAVADSLKTRKILSTYTTRYADLLNYLIEAERRGFEGVARFKEAVKDYASGVTPEIIFRTGRAEKVSRPQVQGYIGKFLTQGLAKGPSNISLKANDFLTERELRITEAYFDIKRFVDESPLEVGAYVRCHKNLHFPQYGEERKAHEQMKYGITCDSKLANGQIFTVKEFQGNRYLECEIVEGKTVVVEVADIDKAAKIFKLAWCSTTHKLQGDQARVSIYIHESSRSENKLVYVAMSRGREQNICLINSTTKQDWLTIKNGTDLVMTRSVKRLSAYAEWLKQQARSAA